MLGQQNPQTTAAMMNAKDLNQCPPRLQRLKIRLARFNYQEQYVPGKELLVADALSRRTQLKRRQKNMSVQCR